MHRSKQLYWQMMWSWWINHRFLLSQHDPGFPLCCIILWHYLPVHTWATALWVMDTWQSCYSRGMMPWSTSCSRVLLCWSLSCRTGKETEENGYKGQQSHFDCDTKEKEEETENKTRQSKKATSTKEVNTLKVNPFPPSEISLIDS